MKKIFYVIGALCLAILGAIVILPFVIDVNQYRGTIESKINEQLNGKITLGKLTLDLWGHIRFKIDGMSIEDMHKKNVMKVADAGLYLPFLSVIGGKPSLDLVLNGPEFNVVKSTDGKLNLMSLYKGNLNTEQGGQNTDSSKPLNAKTENQTLPTYLTNAKVSLIVEKAKVQFSDLSSKATYKLTDIDIKLREISMAGPIPFECSARMQGSADGVIKLSGPVSLSGEITPKGSSGAPFDLLGVNYQFDLSELDILIEGSFHKKSGVALRLESKLDVSADKIDIAELKSRFGAATISIAGKIYSLKKEMDLAVELPLFETKEFSDMIPAIGANGLSGKVGGAVKLVGPTDRPTYDGHLTLENLSLRTASLKEPVALNGQVKLNASGLSLQEFGIQSLPALDGKLTGSIQDFTAPKVNLKFRAQQLNLDALLVPSSANSSQAHSSGTNGSHATSAPSHGGGASSDQNGGIDYNHSFDALKTGIMSKSSGRIELQIGQLINGGLVLKDFSLVADADKLLLNLRNLSFGLFDGTFKVGTTLNLRGNIPEVNMDLEVARMNTQKVIENKMSFAKNTVKGIVSTKVNLSGKGLNRSEINSNWRGSGNISIQNAVFSSLDIGRQMKTGLVDKLPELVKNKVQIKDSLLDWRGEYEQLEMKGNLTSGQLNLSEISGRALPNKGMDLKGSGVISIVDYGMNVSADFIDKYQMLGPNVPKDKRYGVAAISTKVTGSMMSPRYDWTYTIEQLAKNSASDVVKEKGKEVIKKQMENLNLPGGAKNIFKGLFN